MKKKIKRGLEITGGTILIIAGIACFFIPFLTGYPFFIAGLLLISESHGKVVIVWIRRMWYEWHRYEYWSELKDRIKKKNFWKKIQDRKKKKRRLKKMKEAKRKNWEKYRKSKKK